MHTSLKILLICIQYQSLCFMKDIFLIFKVERHCILFLLAIYHLNLKEKNIVFVCHLALFNFPHHMLCSVLEQTLRLLSYGAVLQMMEGGRNPKLFVFEFKSLFSTSVSSFTSLCLELPSKRTIKTIFFRSHSFCLST